MTILLLAAAAALIGHVVRSRSVRDARARVAREHRRRERERQWRAMILDHEEGDPHL